MAKKKTHVWRDGTRHSKPDPSLYTVAPNGTVTYGATGQKVADLMAAHGTVVPTQVPNGGNINPAPVQPLDPNVVNQQVVGQRDVALSDLYSTWQQGNLDQQYGFGAGGAANPYSDAAKLQTNFERSVLGTTNNYAAQGQLYSGAKDRAQNENQRNYDMGYDALRRAYDQASGNIQFGRLQTYANAGTGIDSAKFQAMLDALKGL